MVIRKWLVGVGAVGSFVLTATLALGQGAVPQPGMPAGATMPPVGGPGGGTTTTQTTVTSGDPGAVVTKLPKTGGDPLSIMAAGSILLTAGYSVRRRFNKS